MRDMKHSHDGQLDDKMKQERRDDRKEARRRKVGLDWFEKLHHQLLHEKHVTLGLHTFCTHTRETPQHALDSGKVTELKTEGQGE